MTEINYYNLKIIKNVKPKTITHEFDAFYLFINKKLLLMYSYKLSFEKKMFKNQIFGTNKVPRHVQQL